MEDVIRVDNRFYVLATSSLADSRTRVLKYGDSFAVFNLFGDIEPTGLGQQGLYRRDMRYLSRCVLRLGEQAPQLLRSTIRDDNAFLTVDMMNPDIVHDGSVAVPRGSIHVFRSKFLWKGVCYEHFRLCNYSLLPIETSIRLLFGTDFADIFEVRGTPRRNESSILEPLLGRSHVELRSVGTDGRRRSTALHFSPSPAQLSGQQATYDLSLDPREETSIYLAVACELDGSKPDVDSFDEALEASTEALDRARRDRCRIFTSDARFHAWLARSEADLHMMIAGNPEGDYPYAGIPWFSTVFGRDGIITARECLWIAPGITRTVLHYLAQTQATGVNERDESEPGKIVHEMRHGELANTGEVPFGRYYGSVDATPLFVMLAGAYLERTGDLQFIRSIWRNVLAAIEWMDIYGDRDGDGFVEYEAHGPDGLVQQGWKDSGDSIFHADGTIAAPPIALCEVQGYVYAAKLAASRIAASLAEPERAADLRSQAEALSEQFDRAFWSDRLGSYALALDGHKRRCEVKASNAGHCLFTGIARKERAWQVMNTLMDPELFCGWGIRTLASREVRYNPMAYHNGTVWPHDNAIVARGMAEYGFHQEAARVLSALFETTAFMDLNRLPELFCGFHRRKGAEGPTLYPVACSPQAWAAGAVYLLLEASLGIEVRPDQGCVRFHSPRLPKVIADLQIENLQVGQTPVSLSIRRTNDDSVTIDMTAGDGSVTLDVVS